jgi:low temperature requirement protein LtrA
MLLLGGMGGFMVLSLAIPHAFAGGDVLFGVAYAAIVLIHAGMFTRSERGEGARSILLIAPHNLAMASLIVLGGLIGGSAQYWLWLGAIALIVYNTIPGPRGSFDLAPAHFVERHTLVVIVALGESVVAVGLGAQHLKLSAGMVGLALLGLALSACLWWTYFGDDGDERLLEAFTRSSGVRRQALALTVFYYWHLLLLLGVIALASTLRYAIGDPGATLSPARALALGAGSALFLLGVALSRRSLGIDQTGWRLAGIPLALALVPLGIWISALAELVALVLVVVACLAADAATRPPDGERARRAASRYPRPRPDPLAGAQPIYPRLVVPCLRRLGGLWLCALNHPSVTSTFALSGSTRPAAGDCETTP